MSREIETRMQGKDYFHFLGGKNGRNGKQPYAPPTLTFSERFLWKIWQTILELRWEDGEEFTFNARYLIVVTRPPTST